MGASAPCTVEENQTAIFFNHRLAFKTRSHPLTFAITQFEYMLESVTDLVTMQAVTSIFWPEVKAQLQFKAHTLGRGQSAYLSG